MICTVILRPIKKRGQSKINILRGIFKKDDLMRKCEMLVI